MLKGARNGELLPATTRMLEYVTELEIDIAKYADPRWLAVHGPRLQGIRAANVYYYRDSKAVEPFTKMPKGDDIPYRESAEAFLRLAATCLKIAVDYHLSDAKERRHFAKIMRSDIAPALPESVEVTEDDGDE